MTHPNSKYKKLYAGLCDAPKIPTGVDIVELGSRLNQINDPKVSELVLGVMRENPYHSERKLTQLDDGSGVSFDLYDLSTQQILILWHLMEMLRERQYNSK
jgi:hypothetical protein